MCIYVYTYSLSICLSTDDYVVSIFCVCMLSHFSFVWLFVTLWTAALQAPHSKNNGVSCHSFLQGFFPTQGSNLVLLHCRKFLYHLSHQKSPIVTSHIFFSFFFLISWRLITLQYCSGFRHTLTWISPGYTCIPHPDPPSHFPLYLIPLGLPSAPDPSTCLMHPTWAGDLFHPR